MTNSTKWERSKSQLSVAATNIRVNANLSECPPQEGSAYPVLWVVGIFLLWGLTIDLLNFLQKKLESPPLIDYGELWGVVATATILAGVFWHRRGIFGLSNFRVRLPDALIAITLGYLSKNIALFTLGPKGAQFGNLMDEKYAILIVPLLAPIGEELLNRGVMLSSLLQHMRSTWAVLIVACAVALFHPSFVSALIGQLVLSTLYVWRGRNLFTSMLAHVVMNGILFFPYLTVPVRMHYFKP